jgi:hypothetical protein
MRGAPHCGHLKVSACWEAGWSVMGGNFIRVYKESKWQWKVENEWWKVEGGKWKVEGGKWKVTVYGI